MAKSGSDSDDSDNSKQETENIHEDTLMNDFDDTRFYMKYITIKMTLDSNAGAIEALREKYALLKTTLLEADETIIFLPINPEKTADPLRQDDEIPPKMTGISTYFHSTSRLPKPDKAAYKPIIWANARIAYDGDWEDIVNATIYDLEDANIQLMVKRVQCFKTESPGYFLFVNNQVDPNDFAMQIQEDIGTKWLWSIYNKKPWENNYSKQAVSNKRQEMLAKAPHIECKDSHTGELMTALRIWISRGNAAKRFGAHFKLVESITARTPPGQIDRTLRMNSHGKRFQASVDMIELQGLDNPNGKTSIGKSTARNTSIRSYVLNHTTGAGQPLFLSVTKKWNSSNWQATYILKYGDEAREFAQCPAAYLTHGKNEKIKSDIYKHFTPCAVEEARASEWDDEAKRMITPLERKALSEERELANISWLIDLGDLESPIAEDSAVKFGGGDHFNFNEEVSIKTTRFEMDSPGKEGTSTPSPSTARTASTSKSPVSILRPSCAKSIASEITNDSRIDDLENGVANLTGKLDQILNKIMSNDKQSPSEQVSPSHSSEGDGAD